MAQSRRFHLKALLATCGVAGIGGAAFAADSPLIGTWSGKLTIGSNALRLRLIISDAKTAKVISLDQGNAEIPADTIAIDGDTLKLTFVPIKAEYTGKLTDQNHIEGIFTQMGRPLPLRLVRGETIEEEAVAPLTLPLLQSLRTQARTPAIGAAWQKAGKIFGTLSDGLRSSTGTLAVTMIDQWHWGSITKSMTATLVARLVEAKIVTWQTTAGSVLGAKVPDMQASYKDANFLHLLSHRAGLQPNIDISHLGNYSRDPLPDARAERLKYATEALGQSPAGALAARTIYSNNGYVVAGAMLEAVTGKSWEDLIQTHVFKPLALNSAGFGAPGHTGLIDQPLGHIASGDARTPAPVGPGAINDNPVVVGPAGRVHMNLTDMIRYLSAHRDQPETFLKKTLWETLHTPPFGGDYALGWVVRPDGALWHNGSNTLWYGEILVDKKTGAVCAAAGNDASAATMQAIGQVLMAARAAAIT